MESLEIDMMAEARNAQWSADAFLGPGALKAVAPAKVNLFLGVGERRDDGYHQVVNVMHALALHDVLYFHRSELAGDAGAEAGAAGVDGALRAEALLAHMALVGPADNLLVSVTAVDKTQAVVRAFDIPAAENLVVRALDALARAAGRDACEQITVHIEKNVPHQAGLGGGSADAAAALVAAARLWGLPADDPTLRDVAAGLGADVAFFLDGGCALLEGAGEQLAARLEPLRTPVVLVKPEVGVSTAQAYARFDEAPQPVPADALAQVRNAQRAADIPLFNNLAPAAEALAPELADVRAWLEAALREDAAEGAEDAASRVLLCGSGSCTFALADSFAQASRIAAQASAQGWWARATTLSSLKAASL